MKRLIAFLVAAAVSHGAFAVSSGACESKATTLKAGATKTVKLVNEYDPDWKEYYGDGVYYFAVTLSRGRSYTVWVEGASANAVDLSCYQRDTTESEDDKGVYGPMADFSPSEEFVNAQACWLLADDWDEDDPSSWKYYICVQGDIGTSVTVGVVEGIKMFVEPGTEENPKTISFGTSEARDSATFGDDDYYYAANLTGGRKYLIRTVGGTESAPLDLRVETADDEAEVRVEDDADYASDPYNAALVVYPETSGSFRFIVSGIGSGFQIAYKMVGARALSAHPATSLALGDSVHLTPGALNESNAYYDEIVDGNLYKVALQKGERAVFRTTGASSATKIYAYDARGNVLATNETVGNGAHDVLVAVEATAAATYYVGVCDPTLDIGAPATAAELTLSAIRVSGADGDPDAWDALDDTVDGAAALEPTPGVESDDPTVVNAGHGPHRLSQNDWADCFQIGGRKDVTYVIATRLVGEQTDLGLTAEVFTLSGTRETVLASGAVTPGESLSFTAKVNAMHYVRIRVLEGRGLDYPDYTVHALAYSASGAALGILRVETKGADGTWTLDREGVKYAGGVSILAAGDHTVTFQSVKGFALQGAAARAVSVNPGVEPTVVTGVYSDTYDPKDDTAAAATKLTIPSGKELVSARTLWQDDPADWYLVAAKDGIYYNFLLRKVSGDVTMRLFDASLTNEVAARDGTLEKLALAAGNYYLRVGHGDDASPADGQYELVCSSANVGAVKFAKSAVSAKENAAYVELTVNRTAREGAVRVRYGTVAGSAQPGVDYVAQSGVLAWPAGDSTAKKIRIALIPDLVEAYEGNKTFQVQLLPFGDDALGADEYAAVFAGGSATDTVAATVTLTEASRAGTTAESNYKAVKTATVKTEALALYAGTFTGVLAEDGSALTNGCPALGSITFTASAAGALSAKVALAGKTYTFSAKGWADADPASGAYHEFELTTKVGGVSYVNTLRVFLAGGMTTDPDAWRDAGGFAELVMNVPDANNRGVQADICYTAELVRDNSKIQAYLDDVAAYAGYYTIALVPDGVSVADGVPAGSGYLTMTIDNKGKAKIAGQLADGSTKPSVTVQTALQADGSLLVPFSFVKSPCCFGGTLRLFFQETADPRLVYAQTPVVDSTLPLCWNNDNAALTRDGTEGWRLAPVPVGGYYDTVVNLQTYYLTRALSLDGAAAAVAGNAITLEKNAAGEQTSAITLTFRRATGLTSGTLTYEGVRSVKHAGVMVLARDDAAPLDPDVVAPGAFVRQTTVTEQNALGRTVTRKWIESHPFDLLATDRGELDWWADDWGSPE
ncbi:MAG: Calx-beta domain-containing protein [Kiritimatiellia bacterium]